MTDMQHDAEGSAEEKTGMLDKETAEKLKKLPIDERKKVLDGLAALLAVRPYRYSEELRTRAGGEDSHDVHCQR